MISYTLCFSDYFRVAMVTRCILKGCSKSKRDGVSHHRFPPDPFYKEIWINFVRRTRPNFKGPSFCSFLCSDHFTIDMFHPASLNRIKLGLSNRYHLLNTAVPTILRPKAKNRNDDDKTRSCGDDHNVVNENCATDVSDWISRQQRALTDTQLNQVGF